VAGQPVQASQPIRAGGAGGTELQATIPEPPSGGGRGAGGGGRGVNVGALIIIGTSSSRHATHLASRLLPLGLPLDLSQRLPRAFAHTSELLRDKDCARATRAHPKSKTQRPQEKEAGKRQAAAHRDLVREREAPSALVPGQRAGETPFPAARKDTLLGGGGLRLHAQPPITWRAGGWPRALSWRAAHPA
jgi:hypothetical protein